MATSYGIEDGGHLTEGTRFTQGNRERVENEILVLKRFAILDSSITSITKTETHDEEDRPKTLSR
jgi:hypothetical protein